MNKKEVSNILSDKLQNEMTVNKGFIERLRKSHLIRTMPKYLTIDLEQCQEENTRIHLMMRQEGFDVVVISNNDVFSVEFFTDYIPAKAHYDYLKQITFKGEKC